MLSALALALLVGLPRAADPEVSTLPVAENPPAAASIPPTRSTGVEGGGVALSTPPSTPTPAKAAPSCQCQGDGCACGGAGSVCSVIDGGCEPGRRQRPTATIAPLPVPVVLTPTPTVVYSTVAAPPAPLWRLRDRLGRVFTHTDRVYLESWVAARNVTLAPPVMTYALSPPVTYLSAPPVYQPSYSGFISGFGGGFVAGGSRCGPGGCR